MHTGAGNRLLPAHAYGCPRDGPAHGSQVTRMRILLLIIQFPPDVNPAGVLMAQLGEDLVARGHAVSVLTAFPHYGQFRVWDEYRGKVAQRDLYRGMDVLRLYTYASGRKQNM